MMQIYDDSLQKKRLLRDCGTALCQIFWKDYLY